jgi:cyclophilin family peptidyl-prolyl cis-trans isomerase
VQASTQRHWPFCPRSVLTTITTTAIWLWMPAGEIWAAGKIGQESAAQKAARFPELFRQWEELRAHVQDLIYQSQRPVSAEEFKRLGTLIAEGQRTMKDRRREVTEAAEAAWLENPIKDERAYSFLYSFLHIECVEGRHHETAEIADCLLKRPTDIPAAHKRDVLIVASQTSFDSNSFDQARRRLDGLKGIVVPFTVGMNTMSDRIDDYRRRWDAEQRIRARETAANDLPRVKFVTSKGEITAELFRNEVPVTTANFLRLVGENAYDVQRIGFADDLLKRHFGFRVGANTTNVGQKDSSVVQETSTHRREQFRGSLCMLDSGQGASETRFMIAFVPIPDTETQMRFTVIGRVIDGYDVLDRVDSDQSQDKNNQRIERAIIVRQ